MSLVICGAKKCYDFVNDSNHYKMYGYYPRRAMSGQEKIKEFISLLIHLSAGFMAAYIAWDRNKSSGIVVQLLVSILAFLFGVIYLVYITGVLLLNNDSKRDSYLNLLAQNSAAAAGGMRY